MLETNTILWLLLTFILILGVVYLKKTITIKNHDKYITKLENVLQETWKEERKIKVVASKKAIKKKSTKKKVKKVVDKIKPIGKIKPIVKTKSKSTKLKGGVEDLELQMENFKSEMDKLIRGK